jgi:hypothetical protein
MLMGMGVRSVRYGCRVGNLYEWKRGRLIMSCILTKSNSLPYLHGLLQIHRQ